MMNLAERRKAWAGRYPHDAFVHGGTFYYCIEHVDELDEGGRRTGGIEACGARFRTLAKLFRHVCRKH